MTVPVYCNSGPAGGDAGMVGAVAATAAAPAAACALARPFCCSFLYACSMRLRPTGCVGWVAQVGGGRGAEFFCPAPPAHGAWPPRGHWAAGVHIWLWLVWGRARRARFPVVRSRGGSPACGLAREGEGGAEGADGAPAPAPTPPCPAPSANSWSPRRCGCPSLCGHWYGRHRVWRGWGGGVGGAPPDACR